MYSLPPGAAFTSRDGRLTLEARRDGDTLRLIARCDSLARRSIYYEQTALRHSARSDSLQERLTHHRQSAVLSNHTSTSLDEQLAEKQSRTPSRWGTWLLTGFAAGIAAGWYVHKRWQ